MSRAALTAHARLRVERGTRMRWSQAWPVLLRPTGVGQVHLVHGAGGPLGGDAFTLDVDVAAGESLAVRSAGATLVQPGSPEPGTPEPARWDVTARVGADGWLDWAPEPTVVCTGAALEASLRLDLAAGGQARLREVVVLGRHGEQGGRCTFLLDVRVENVPLLAHTTVLDGADPALTGPAGTSGARAVGSLFMTGPAPTGAGEAAGVRWACTALDGPGALLLAVGKPAAVLAVLGSRNGRPTGTR